MTTRFDGGYLCSVVQHEKNYRMQSYYAFYVKNRTLAKNIKHLNKSKYVNILK